MEQQKRTGENYFSNSSSGDEPENTPPVSFVSFIESSMNKNSSNAMTTSQIENGDNIFDENKNRDDYDIEKTSPSKTEYRKIFPSLEKLSLGGKSDATDNYNTTPTATPSEFSLYEEESAYEYESEKVFRSSISSKQNAQISPMTSDPCTPLNTLCPGPKHDYESFSSLLKAQQENYLEEGSASPLLSHTPPHSNKSNFQAKDTDISFLSNDSTEGKDEFFTGNSHDNTHFQSFILSLAFLAVWLPQNVMAPNLTQMADYFEFDASQRDTLLGANIALATGVLSLPISGVIGFLADIVKSRRDLFSLTVFMGGLASLSCGLSRTYTELYFARFINGGCMAGCTPIAFSMLGDLFETAERNMASSALTAMMGVGMVAGQVVAGMIGPSLGWKLPFHLSAVLCWITSIAVLLLVDEPVRGGKEEVIQEMLKKGKAYDRRLTLSGFMHAMQHNSSNVILMLQGFFCSLPWGIIFVFLNDYLSQEQGLSVKAATFLVFIFGLGCAAGGLFGGIGGQYFSTPKISHLPIFMAVTTLLGIFPFLGLLDAKFNVAGLYPMFLAFSGGMMANLPSVNVRPCLINVNPPEMRGAALTAANSVINLARGFGPFFLTSMCSIFDVDRQFSFNVLVSSLFLQFEL